MADEPESKVDRTTRELAEAHRLLQAQEVALTKREMDLATATRLLAEMLRMWNEAGDADDACVGYKSRARIENQVLVFLGRDEQVQVIQPYWRE